MAPRPTDGLIQRLGALLFGAKQKADADSLPSMGSPAASRETTRVSGDYDPQWREMFGLSQERRLAYRDYETMETESSVVSAGLDQLADGALTGADGDFDKVFDVVFPDADKASESLTQQVHDRIKALDKRLGIKRDSRTTIRELAMMGDHFEELVFDGQSEIVERRPLPQVSIVRVPKDGPYGPDDVALQQYDIAGTQITEFRDWQVVQYMIRVRPCDLYGRSFLHSARRPYRQLQAIEDGMVINRLTRATQRSVWQVPVGEATGEAAMNMVEEYKRRLRRVRRFDPRTGKLMVQRNVLDEEQDLFVAVGTKIGQGNVSALNPQPGMDKIDDVMYFHRKVIAAIGVPGAFVGFEQDTRDKAVITALDVAYARRMRTLQRAWGAGVRQIFDSQLLLDGASPEAFGYQLAFAPVATVDEMRRWQIELLKTQVASALKMDGLVSDDEFILRKVLEYEEDDVRAIKKANDKAAADAQAQFDAQNQAASDQAAAAQANQPAQGEERRPRVKVDADLRDALVDALGRTSVRRQLAELRGLARPTLVEYTGDHVVPAA